MMSDCKDEILFYCFEMNILNFEMNKKMNDFFMKKYLGYKNPWKAAYVSPLIASAVMGVVAAGVYYGFHAILPSNIICLGVSIILAAAAYFLVYILVDKTASERLSRMPGGAYLVRIAQRIRR